MKTLTVFLLLLSLTAPSTQILDTLLHTVVNLSKLSLGVLKFLTEILQFYLSEVSNQSPSNGQEFDFVIVGAGSAGAIVATRLSEISNASILLLEAGGHESLLYDIPIFSILLSILSNINWEYKTERSDKYCTGMINQQCNVNSGKVMGGSSNINVMIAVRGNRHDYDEWYNLTGDPNWSYEGMLKSFKKLENFEANLAPVEQEFHNFDGPVRLANPAYITPLGHAFVKAGEELGFPPVDYNGRKQTGFSYLQTNQINGERLSSNRAYLHPARNRLNLVVSIKSYVTKVLIDPNTKIAYGVEYVKNDKKYKIKARKEVILCAGAISTPKILMLSGIGPTEHLRNFNINVLQDAPVGENMKDHATYGVLHFFVNGTPTIVFPDLLPLSENVLADYLNKRRGPLTSLGPEGLGYVNVDNMTAENEVPNVELMFSGLTFLSIDLAHKTFGIPKKAWKQVFVPYLYRHAYLIWPVLMKPKSTGKILLRSANPFDKPRIIPNYFSDPDDVRISIKAIRLAIEVSKTKAMQKYGAHLFNFTVPGCEKCVPDSDDYWECALRTYTITLWHNCGTARMGRENDTTAVVNTRLQVKGIKNLRVADLSIMPNIVTAHTNLPAMAIGEKFADILKKDYGYV